MIYLVISPLVEWKVQVSFSQVNQNVYLDDSLPIQFVVGGWIPTGKCGND